MDPHGGTCSSTQPCHKPHQCLNPAYAKRTSRAGKTTLPQRCHPDLEREQGARAERISESISFLLLAATVPLAHADSRAGSKGSFSLLSDGRSSSVASGRQRLLKPGLTPRPQGSCEALLRCFNLKTRFKSSSVALNRLWGCNLKPLRDPQPARPM